MNKHDAPESDLYLHAKLLGIEHKKGSIYAYDGETYRVNIRVRDPEFFRAVGGKNRAYKLVRHAVMINHFSQQPGSEHIAGVVAKSLDALNRRHPTLRSHYERVARR